MFDGVCNLCNAGVRFIAANDPAHNFDFLALQSPLAAELLGVPPAERDPDTIVLLEHGRSYERSDAVLHIALGLRAPWPLAFAAILIPRAAREAVYRWVAHNRYRWFGRLDVCALPPPGLQERFLDDSATS